MQCSERWCWIAWIDLEHCCASAKLDTQEALLCMILMWVSIVRAPTSFVKVGVNWNTLQRFGLSHDLHFKLICVTRVKSASENLQVNRDGSISLYTQSWQLPCLGKLLTRAAAGNDFLTNCMNARDIVYHCSQWVRFLLLPSRKSCVPSSTCVDPTWSTARTRV